jgi:hypothetical protein
MARVALGTALPSVGCGPAGPVAEPSEGTVDERLRAMSAGWLGCQPERVAISEARATPGDGPGAPSYWTWVASCGDVAMVCSGSGEARCSPRRPDAALEAPTRVTRALPPEVVACTERPVAVEGLFDNVGRLVELRPWPGETPEMRTCVFRALEDIELPEGRGALVRFEPRDPWEAED